MKYNESMLILIKIASIFSMLFIAFQYRHFKSSKWLQNGKIRCFLCDKQDVLICYVIQLKRSKEWKNHQFECSDCLLFVNHDLSGCFFSSMRNKIECLTFLCHQHLSGSLCRSVNIFFNRFYQVLQETDIFLFFLGLHPVTFIRFSIN